MEVVTAGDNYYRNWSNLLDEILWKIWHQHEEPQLQADLRRRLRAVCSYWRAIVPLSDTRNNARYPLLSPNVFDSDTPFYLAETIYYLVTPLARSEIRPKPWLVRVEEREKNRWSARNPFSGIYYLFYPSTFTSTIDNLLDYQVREISRSYYLKRKYHPHYLSNLDVDRVKPFRKVITSDDNVFLALNLNWFLLFWKVGDAKWTKLGRFHETHKDRLVEFDGKVTDDKVDDKVARFVDVASHKGKFYAIELRSGDIYIIDPIKLARNNDVRPIKVETTICIVGCQYPAIQIVSDKGRCKLSNCSLVEHKGLLYYVRYIRGAWRKSQRISLFVLEKGPDKNGWVSVQQSEMFGRLIYLLGEASFVVPGIVAGGGLCSCCKYIPDHYKDYVYNIPYPACKDHFEKWSFRKPKITDDECKSIFFPPPPWLKWCDKKQDDGALKFVDWFSIFY